MRLARSSSPWLDWLNRFTSWECAPTSFVCGSTRSNGGEQFCGFYCWSGTRCLKIICMSMTTPLCVLDSSPSDSKPKNSEKIWHTEYPLMDALFCQDLAHSMRRHCLPCAFHRTRGNNPGVCSWLVLAPGPDPKPRSDPNPPDPNPPKP